MANIIFSKSSGLNDAQIGKLETPIKMVIEHESDLLTKQGGIRDWLFNVEKSKRGSETIIGQNEFDVFSAVPEGSEGDNDMLVETYKKVIEHIQFMKEFTITAEMMEDANYGVAADAKRRAENFTRAYYKTQHKICSFALANATASKNTFAKAALDLTTGDDLPLFHKSHVWGSDAKKKGMQSNYFYTADAIGSATVAEDLLSEFAVKMRNVKDENGDALGYVADTLILPGNRPSLERYMKKACGTEQANGGTTANYINTQDGNWTIVVLPEWQVTADEFMIMSSEANKNLSGNLFFNRVPLAVSNWIDHHTGNYIWNGRCRFGVGFGTYKHIMRCTVSSSAIATATKL